MCVVMKAPRCLVVVELMPYRRLAGADIRSSPSPLSFTTPPAASSKTCSVRCCTVQPPLFIDSVAHHGVVFSFSFASCIIHPSWKMESFTSSEDEQWVKDQGVPDIGQPFIQKYLQGRDSLVAQEKKQRSGSLEIRGLCHFLSLSTIP